MFKMLEAAFHMDSPPKYYNEFESKTVAVMFIGNAGAGKSTLLSQIGGTFKSGAKFRQGFTQDITEEWVELNGEEILLVDVPGLFEPDNKRTKRNAELLSEALKKGYDYKLYFVLKASNRGPDDADMVMMSRINECIQQANGAKVSFRVIINQIQDDEVEKMYRTEVAEDNFKSLFESLDIENFSFDINIDSVTLVRFNEQAVKNRDADQYKILRDTISSEVREQKKARVSLVKDIELTNEDLKLYQKALLALASPLIVAGGLVVGVVGGTGWALYKTARLAHRGMQKAFSSEE
ncbi:hypothetical protein BGZ96_000494 [Linnemannia gamsii]|uniref:G domain-containing protein n=1 Tax=Linnemannia gamsii TaxID=64522 RepID=A0ABQ7JNY2_9FUNG|nr:hypothetical protein BGZ96_000494 [Linnemannia gamsii]